jgi:hypothetical protein
MLILPNGTNRVGKTPGYFTYPKPFRTRVKRNATFFASLHAIIGEGFDPPLGVPLWTQGGLVIKKTSAIAGNLNNRSRILPRT